MSRELESWLSAIVEELAWNPREGLSILGEPEDTSEADVDEDKDDAPDELQRLTTHVAHRHLLRWRPAPDTTFSHGSAGLPAFVEQLDEAAGEETCWEEGWFVISRDRAWAFVTDGEVNVFLPQRDESMAPADAPPDASVSVKLPCVRENLWPGTFTVISRAGAVPREQAHLTLFLNVVPEGALGLVKTLRLAEAAQAVRFDLQVVNDPAEYDRRDTAQIHVARADLPVICEVVKHFYDSHPEAFRSDEMPFTRTLVPGLSVAEAAPEASFVSRCSSTVSAAILSALRGDVPFEQWAPRLKRELHEKGLSFTPNAK